MRYHLEYRYVVVRIGIFRDMASAKEWLTLPIEDDPDMELPLKGAAVCIQYELDLEEGISYVTVEGKISLAEITAQRERLKADSKHRANLDCILELRLSNFALTDQEIESLTQSVRPLRKFAIIVGMQGGDFAEKLQPKFKTAKSVQDIQRFGLGPEMEWTGR